MNPAWLTPDVAVAMLEGIQAHLDRIEARERQFFEEQRLVREEREAKRQAAFIEQQKEREAKRQAARDAFKPGIYTPQPSRPWPGLRKLMGEDYDRWLNEEDSGDDDDEDFGVDDDFKPVSPASPAREDFKPPAVDPARPIGGEVTVSLTPEPPRLPQASTTVPAACPTGDDLKPVSPAVSPASLVDGEGTVLLPINTLIKTPNLHALPQAPQQIHLTMTSIERPARKPPWLPTVTGAALTMPSIEQLPSVTTASLSIERPARKPPWLSIVTAVAMTSLSIDRSAHKAPWLPTSRKPPWLTAPCHSGVKQSKDPPSDLSTPQLLRLL